MLMPRIITITPAAMRIYPETPPISKKVAEMIILKTINTAVNPRIKQKAAISSLKRFLFSVLISLDTGTPPRTLKNDGIRGSTQGEKNERSPAVKTKTNEGYSLTVKV